LVGIVVFIVIVGVVGYFLVPAAPAINVTEITFQSADNPCGLATNYTNWQGFTANESQVEWISFSVGGNATPGGGTSACTIHSVASGTSGFTLSGADTPLTIPANTNETLQFNVTCPAATFSGDLLISLT
jgi:hypothetical protein